jgi:glutathione S-transferase
MRRADEQGIAGLLHVQPRGNEKNDVPAVPQREDEESEESAMAEWWIGFLYGAGAVSVGEVVLAVAIWLWIRHQDRKALRRIEARLGRYTNDPRVSV